MNSYFVIQRVKDRTLWVFGDYWTADPSDAAWFETMVLAERTAARELPDPAPEWQVIEIRPEAA